MRTEEILRRMSLREKLDLCCGGNFWQTVSLPRYGLAGLVLSDGPHGLRFQGKSGDMLGVNKSAPATCFPTASLAACCWDRRRIRQMAEAIAAEAARLGVDVILGPGVNIKRNPLCGRNFEYYTEDPCLSGQLGAAFVRGAQKNGTGACLKHFAGNSQEYKRFSSDDSMDERALREIYLPAFEYAVKEGDPAFVMCAYNKLNGIYCSDHRQLLSDILRKEWGFSGIVVTDWGAMHDRTAGFRAGCDLSMPGGSVHHQRHAAAAVRRGDLDVRDVDASAGRILKQMISANRKRKKDRAAREMSREHKAALSPGKTLKAKKADRFFALHHRLARRLAAESAVLLKNEGALPIRAENVCLIGAMADRPRIQGAGSSHVHPTRMRSLRDVRPDWNYVPGYDAEGNTNGRLLAKACRAVREAETAVVVVGLPDRFESEGYDREHMRLPDGHNRLVKAVAKANPNTAVLLVCGSPVELPWYDRVNALLYLGLPGQAGYEAAAELLTGKAVPCGKLAESWPLRYADVVSGSFYGKPHKNAQYRESIYVGYRYYESAGVPVRFPFGFGMSYTSFAYKNLYIDSGKVSLTVKNTGNCAGAEIVQLYISPENRHLLHRPAKELRGFEKVFLEPGEEKTVTFLLDRRCFALWQEGWKVPDGTYGILIGASVQDIRLQKKVEMTEDFYLSLPEMFGKQEDGANADTLDGSGSSIGKSGSGQETSLLHTVSAESGETVKEAGDLWYARLSGIPSQEEFEKLLGRKIPEEPAPRRGEYGMENTIAEMAEDSRFMRVLKWAMEQVIAKMYGTKPDDKNPEFKMSAASSIDSALFNMVNNAGKLFPERLAHILLDVANGRYFK